MNIPVPGNQRLEFRAEAFNVTNRQRVGTKPNGFRTLNNNTLVQINFSADASILQFALKFSF